MIARPKSDGPRPAALCLEGAVLDTVFNGHTTHSGIYKGRCMKGGRKLAQVTLWYFPDGRYDLTIEDCTATGCRNGWFMPI